MHWFMQSQVDDSSKNVLENFSNIENDNFKQFVSLHTIQKDAVMWKHFIIQCEVRHGHLNQLKIQTLSVQDVNKTSHASKNLVKTTIWYHHQFH